MLTEQTLDIMRALRLTGMLEALEEQYRMPQINDLSFDERLGLLIDAERCYRENKRLQRYHKAAKFRYSQACIEDLDYAPRRKLTKSVVLQLGTCRWIKEHQNVIITGATGVGKSYLACALGVQACRRGYKTIYRRAPRLFDELTLAHADGTFTRLLNQFAKTDLVIIDDFGMTPLKAAERRDLLEIIEDRDNTRSTIVAGQLPADDWYDYLNDPTTADAICDRLIHNSHKIELKGPSKRKELALKEKKD